MGYSRYKIALLFRIIILFIALSGLAFTLNNLNFKEKLPLAIVLLLPILFLIIFITRNLLKFSMKRFTETDDFFESIKYRDFSRWFTEKSGPRDIRELHKGFNNVFKTITAINSEKEAQHLYLEKILELVGTGIVAYNIESGAILWINESFKKALDIPSLMNTSFVKKRNPELYNAIFKTNHVNGKTISVTISKVKTRILAANSVFKINEDSFNLIILQNIDDQLNRSESEAWKKLLSVMTHEIMNSIAPISSLADTLQSQIRMHIDNPKDHELEVADLDTGIESIKKRSEGLLKFAKTYRSLNKITKLNLSLISVKELFSTIKILMLPSLKNKNIELIFEEDNFDLQIKIDTYLIEQVLINLILNAVDACKDREHQKIVLSAQKSLDGNSILMISDNGKGIPKEILDDIFVPFFSTKKNGSGIGLSLSKQIMLLHKGKIQVNTIENTGTVIRLVF